jgi:hypothetical protein
LELVEDGSLNVKVGFTPLAILILAAVEDILLF